VSSVEYIASNLRAEGFAGTKGLSARPWYKKRLRMTQSGQVSGDRACRGPNCQLARSFTRLAFSLTRATGCEHWLALKGLF
jgi:hypothetical protein